MDICGTKNERKELLHVLHVIKLKLRVKCSKKKKKKKGTKKIILKSLLVVFPFIFVIWKEILIVVYKLKKP